MQQMGKRISVAIVAIALGVGGSALAGCGKDPRFNTKGGHITSTSN